MKLNLGDYIIGMRIGNENFQSIVHNYFDVLVVAETIEHSTLTKVKTKEKKAIKCEERLYAREKDMDAFMASLEDEQRTQISKLGKAFCFP